MFEQIFNGISEFFSNVVPGQFCLSCFINGLFEGLAIGILALAAIAAAPAWLAVALVVGLAVLGAYGIAQLVNNWGTMSDEAKSHVLGGIVGGLLAGKFGPPLPPNPMVIPIPSVAFLDTGNTLVPVLVSGGGITVPAAVTGGASAGAAAVGAAGSSAMMTQKGGSDRSSKSRRQQNPEDTTVASEEEARQEALKRHGAADTDLQETKPVYGKNPNLKGPSGEPYEKVSTIDKNGQLIEIDHHKWGHKFPDGTYEYPHYHGPNGEHISYPPGGSSE